MAHAWLLAAYDNTIPQKLPTVATYLAALATTLEQLHHFSAGKSLRWLLRASPVQAALSQEQQAPDRPVWAPILRAVRMGINNLWLLQVSTLTDPVWDFQKTGLLPELRLALFLTRWTACRLTCLLQQPTTSLLVDGTDIMLSFPPTIEAGLGGHKTARTGRTLTFYPIPVTLWPWGPFPESTARSVTRPLFPCLHNAARGQARKTFHVLKEAYLTMSHQPTFPVNHRQVWADAIWDHESWRRLRCLELINVLSAPDLAHYMQVSRALPHYTRGLHLRHLSRPELIFSPPSQPSSC